MSRIGRLGHEIIDRIKNKINSGAINDKSAQKTPGTFTVIESSDTFERLSSNGTLLDASLGMHGDIQESCEEFTDEYAYSEQYEQEHNQTMPKEILNIIA